MVKPTEFFLTAGQDHDLKGADALISQLVQAQAVLSDKAYDADERMRYKLQEKNVRVVIPSKKNYTNLRPYDKHLYKKRYFIENFFAKLKQYRSNAIRYDKTAQKFLRALDIVASMILIH